MDFRVPELGEGVYEAELVAWLVKVGDLVKRGQELMEVLTDKATMEVPAPFSGTISALHAQPGQQIKVGDRILSYTAASGSGDGEISKTKEQREHEREPRTGGNGADLHSVTQQSRQSAATTNRPMVATSVKAAPSVRYLARKLGIDLARVRGSGPQGRILIDDLSTHLRPSETTDNPSLDGVRQDYGKPGTRVKLIGLRRKIADHMVQSKRIIPHYSYVDECDLTELVRLRDSLRDKLAASGVKLTYLAFFVKATVAALKEVPLVNSSLDESAGEIVLHDRYDIGVAVATPSGLIVPVVREADKKSIVEIAREIDRLGADARTGKTQLNDLRGSTFTITSIGSVGGLISTPIINHPEVGILGIGKVVRRPVYDSAGNLHPADVAYLSFSFDHRVLDGAVGAAFGNALIRQLQSPASLLLSEHLA